jgi:hypothetical protein
MCLVWLPRDVLNRLNAVREPSESYSYISLMLAKKQRDDSSPSLRQPAPHS